MKRALSVLCLLVVVVCAGLAYADDASQPNPCPSCTTSPGNLVIYTELPFARSKDTRVYIACVDNAFHNSGACFQDDDLSAWNVARCSADGCEYNLPFVRERVRGEFDLVQQRIHFDTTAAGTYFVEFRRTSKSKPWDTTVSLTTVQRGRIRYVID